MLPVPGHQRRMADGRTKNPGDQRAKFRCCGGLGRFRQCRLRQLVGRDLVDFLIGWSLDIVRDQRFDRRGNQVLFGGPTAIDGQLADAGPFRDLLDAGALDAAFDEQLKPGTQDRVDTAIVVPTSGGGMLPSLPNDFAALSSSTAINEVITAFRTLRIREEPRARSSTCRPATSGNCPTCTTCRLSSRSIPWWVCCSSPKSVAGSTAISYE